MKKRGMVGAWLLVTFVVVVVLGVYGGIASAAKYQIGWAMESMSHPWLVQHVDEGNKVVAGHPDVELVVRDGQDKITKMISDIEDLLVGGVDFILITPGKTVGLEAVLKRVREAGIPYAFVGKGYKDPNALFFMADDNFQCGQILGYYHTWILGAKGNVVELFGIPGDATAIERSKGFHSVIDNYPGIKVVANIPADYRREPAVKAMEDILQAHPEGTIDSVFAANGEMGMGAAIAAKRAGRLGEFFITTIDAGKWEVEGIINGEIGASAAYRICGTAGVTLAIGYLKGEVRKEDIAKVIHPPAKLVDPVNAEESLPEEEVLFLSWKAELEDIVQ
ncbi:sugar ABC transporter substrate-binding protein [Candidatus Aerophobetes bacterium]|uniref:Sugar ABC transporter substrate-binding protein n=1 Tax=Aerophobetes bacterium TaxID=2030807 RepID=A0A523QKP5_UNCAE|nr:MAG: sugar ABC transporter substrate-binding protein [Candidatus Aerophobetes bacterium]